VKENILGKPLPETLDDMLDLKVKKS